MPSLDPSRLLLPLGHLVSLPLDSHFKRFIRQNLPRPPHTPLIIVTRGSFFL
jgi:hypothetical protein